MNIFFLALIGLTIYLSWRLNRLQEEKAEQAANSAKLQEEKKVVFDLLHDLGEAFAEEIDRHQLLNIILESSLRVTGARSGVVYLVNSQRTQISAEAVSGMFPPPVSLPPEAESKVVTREEYLETVLRNEVIKLDSPSILIEALNSEEGFLVADAKDDIRFPKFHESSLRVQTFIAVPLRYREEKLGILALANRLDDGAFGESDYEIVRSIAFQASFSLYNANVFSQLAEKQRLDRDLETAREIQRILLPDKCPIIEGYEIAALNIPAQHVSGDYYDFVEVDEHRLGIAIADVSGKGVPASLIMAMCRTVLRTQAPGRSSAADVLRQVNRILYPDIREDMFITMAYAVLDFKHNTITLAKAGHDAPMFYQGADTLIQSLQTPGIALGIDGGEVFDAVVEDLVIPFQSEDTLLLYTDGVNEAVDAEEQEFGKEQIKNALKLCASGGAAYLIQNIVERVTRFRGDQPQNDDITLVTIKKK
ncbi:MAG: GAF domain-containing SpoIIE family protein phosphatase [Blastochloris sp.]|nr:GAF domain-containing SpoIIE family protein phosphatase [Blastochloris sp.]